MSERAAGSIYDLGYRRYQGARLGRQFAALSLYYHSLRAAFGLGRRTRSKLFPFGLAILAAIPAIVQLSIGAIASTADVEVFEAEEYYGYIQVILALFAAAVAPELFGRDQRHRTLSLYFSRAISRDDYAFAKLAAMTSAMIVLTVGPQAVLFIGNALAVDDFDGYFRDEWDQVAPILLSGVLVSAFVAAIAAPIAAQTPRRSFATIGILVPFLISLPVAALLVESLSSSAGSFGVFLSPFAIIRGFTLWFFDASPDAGSLVEQANFAGGFYALAAVIVIVAGAVLTIRRFRGLSA